MSAEWVTIAATTLTGTKRPYSIADLLSAIRVTKDTPEAKKPVTAKGGHRVVIRTGDETIVYESGRTKIEGLITPAAQDALEPKLRTLAGTRDKAIGDAVAKADAALSQAKAAYEKAVSEAHKAREAAISTATLAYEQSAREAILAASAGK